jgi:hypothetical protein
MDNLKTRVTLFDIEMRFRQFSELMEINDGEVTDYSAMLEEEIQRDTPTAIDSLLKMAHELDTEAGMWEEQEKVFSSRKKAARDKAERLRNHVERFMLDHGITELSLPMFPKLKIGAMPDKVEVSDALDFTTVPEVFIRTKPPEFNKSEYLKAWKQDKSLSVPGVVVVTDRTGIKGHTIKGEKDA